MGGRWGTHTQELPTILKEKKNNNTSGLNVKNMREEGRRGLISRLLGVGKSSRTHQSVLIAKNEQWEQPIDTYMPGHVTLPLGTPHTNIALLESM